MTDQNETPTPMRRIGAISLEDRLYEIERLLRELLARENVAATDVALIKSKLELHDRILMGVCGVIGLAVLGAIIAKVVH